LGAVSFGDGGGEFAFGVVAVVSPGRAARRG
jgi:hypothetical protein